MNVTVAAHRINPEVELCTVDIPLSEFNAGMDGDAVRETLEMYLVGEANLIDIDETDLYIEAERVYQALKNE